MDEYKGSATTLVADVDCTTAAGKPLCHQQEIKGYPTIKYGDPSALEDYQGGRSFDDLARFVKTNLVPTCGPAHLGLCNDEELAMLEKFEAMSDADLEAAIAEQTSLIDREEKGFAGYVDHLQKAYEKIQKDKDEGIKAIKESGLGLMKAVAAAAEKAGKPKEEL